MLRSSQSVLIFASDKLLTERVDSEHRQDSLYVSEQETQIQTSNLVCLHVHACVYVMSAPKLSF